MWSRKASGRKLRPEIKIRSSSYVCDGWGWHGPTSVETLQRGLMSDEAEDVGSVLLAAQCWGGVLGEGLGRPPVVLGWQAIMEG